MNDIPVISVSQLNTYVKSLLESNQNLKSVYISGEISNFTNHYSSGHFYLTLKDDKSAIKAVMFRSAAQKVVFTPENGMKVICRGRVSLFERDGTYQLYIDDMQPDGVGALQLAFEQLKIKLSEAGLFDQESKRPIPKYPESVAVITSATGAALQDIINVISRRYPVAQIVLCPALVQGEQAAPSLIAAVRKVNQLKCADVIIIGRGGGSIEDLWAFNDEKLAYAVFESDIPIISAVGHEVDFTICDFVADLRAPTPSAAAELAVPDITDVLSALSAYKSGVLSRCTAVIRSCEESLKSLSGRRSLASPDAYLDSIGERLDALEHKIRTVGKMIIEKYYSQFAFSAARIDAMSPLKTLSRGYSIAKTQGKVVKSVTQISEGSIITLSFSDGAAECSVNKTVRSDKNG